jgi:hypothetical protein
MAESSDTFTTTHLARSGALRHPDDDGVMFDLASLLRRCTKSK